jgi:hypothetical protein
VSATKNPHPHAPECWGWGFRWTALLLVAQHIGVEQAGQDTTEDGGQAVRQDPLHVTIGDRRSNGADRVDGSAGDWAEEHDRRSQGHPYGQWGQLASLAGNGRLQDDTHQQKDTDTFAQQPTMTDTPGTIPTAPSPDAPGPASANTHAKVNPATIDPIIWVTM